MFLNIFTIAMILFVGLRDGTVVGTDSPAYYKNYLYQNWEVEYGYKYLNLYFSKNSINYNVFLIFINSISLYNISKFIKNYSPYLIFSLFIYFSDFFLYYNFSGIRQAIALSFVSISVNYLFCNKRIIALLLIILASTFHITAIIFLAGFFIPKERMTTKNYLKFIGIIILGAFVANFLIQNVEYLKYKFLYYSELQVKSENIQVSYIVGILKRLIVLICIYFVRKNYFFRKENIFLFNLYIVGLVIYIATYLISPDFGVRFSTYFTLMDCVIIGNIIWCTNASFKKIILFFVFACMAIYKISTYVNTETFLYKLAF